MEKGKHRTVSLEGEKIVTATHMAEMEAKAIASGDGSDDQYMQTAARGIASVVFDYIEETEEIDFSVLILSGKGNNGGDAYSAGEIFAEANIPVVAYQFFPENECSPLCKLHMKQFQDAGGKVYFPKSIEEIKIHERDIVLDGLFGSGFHGALTGLVKEAVDKVNQTENTVIAIDIASGVSGNTGKVEGSAIIADITVYLGLLKIGHFYNNGFEHVGRLIGVDFGISSEYIEKIEPFAHLVNHEIASYNLPKRARTANKYTVGQGIVVAGSLAMPGAALLATKAALRSGIGILRLFYGEGMEKETMQLPPEVIRKSLSLETIDEMFQEFARTKAILVGPGLGREEKVKELLKAIYKKVTVPLVIDGDALFFFDEAPPLSILTPHRGELLHLLKITGPIDDIDLLEKATTFAKQKKVILLCKGAPTTAISPQGQRIVIPYGNSGMASAGMGDALAGIILSLLAQGSLPYEAAVLGALLHAFAGDRAKETKSAHSMTASDLIDSLPDVFL